MPTFDIESIDRAFQRSRQALRREIDVLLLHEARSSALGPEVFDWLERRRDAGQIRTFGAGTQLCDLEEISISHVLHVWQYSAAEMMRAGGKASHRGTHIIHGVFGTFKELVREHICRGADTDPADEREVARLCLAAALEMNAKGSVLLATRKFANLRMAADVISDKNLRQRAAWSLRCYFSTLSLTDQQRDLNT